MAGLFLAFGFRFFYRSYDLLNEPCHIHVQQGHKLCKYWIRADGTFVPEFVLNFSSSEQKKIERKITEEIKLIQSAYENDCAQADIPVNYYEQ